MDTPLSCCHRFHSLTHAPQLPLPTILFCMKFFKYGIFKWWGMNINIGIYNTTFYSTIFSPVCLPSALNSTKISLLLCNVLSQDFRGLTAATHNMRQTRRGLHWSSTLNQIPNRWHLVPVSPVLLSLPSFAH